MKYSFLETYKGYEIHLVSETLACDPPGSFVVPVISAHPVDTRSAAYLLIESDREPKVARLLAAAEALMLDALDRGECHHEETGEMHDDWQELKAAIAALKGSGADPKKIG
ncbi:MAG: hypothetical protein M0036_00090 [Desulfobacteraceae bacterium]|nr:hypothetical protein [Desulfobacteraceae bacterium]